jgi:CRISPR-associated protein Cas2
MNRSPKAWLVCYDITDDKRRTRVRNILRGYGDGIQFSVFRCILSELQHAQLRARVEEELKHDEDQVLLVPLGSPDPSRFARWIAIGRPTSTIERTVMIL